MTPIWNGKHGKGAMRLHREVLREEAEERNAKTPLEKRRAYREGTPEERLLHELYTEGNN